MGLFTMLSLLNTNLKSVQQFSGNINQFDQQICYGEILQTKLNASGFRTFQIGIHQVTQQGNLLPINTKVFLISKTSESFKEGYNIAFKANLEPFTQNPNPGSFDAKYYFENHGFSGFAFVDESCLLPLEQSSSITGYFSRWRAELSALFDEQLPERESGIAKALLLGAKTDIDQDVLNSFSNTGAMHVLAVSGLHIGILLIIIRQILGIFHRLLSKKQILILSLLAIWMFTLISGASPSVLRSTIMFTMLSIGLLIERKSNGLNALALSGIVLLFMDPSYLFDLGFQLSYAALFGIFIFQKPIEKLWSPKRKWMQWLWSGSAVGIAATITTTPIVLYFTHQFPNYFLLSNIVVMLFGFILLLLLLLYLVVVRIPWINVVVAFLCLLSIRGLIVGIDLVDRIPGAVSSGFTLTGTEVALAYGIIACFIVALHAEKHLNYLWVSVAVLLGWISLNRWNNQQQTQLILFSENHLSGVIQLNENSYLFYDPQITPKKIQQYERDFERIQGTKVIEEIALKPINIFEFANKRIQITANDVGWEITTPKHTFQYYSKDIPSKEVNPLLLNKRNHLRLFNKPPTKIFRIAI
jgi:competence protein ComEC